ncbi:Glutathione Peroxidase [Zostera marina]|uniref:Glutathione peroxidase n=1 Tax=Zostera marina TaxID=29655 RepID=A0A0K9NJX4_ZOSMR|nr:Glutathione Peroxidase [Zostera marina]
MNRFQRRVCLYPTLLLGFSLVLFFYRNPPPSIQDVDHSKVNVKSIYDITVKDIHGDDVNLRTYNGKVLLIVNVASKCGFTDLNYKEMNILYEKYRSQGFEILAFPCNQFGEQEPGSNFEINETVCKVLKAKFPIFEKINVNGEDASPLYKYLKEQKGGVLGDSIKWNFAKFLVDKNGHVTQRYASTTSPLQIEDEIKLLLG